MEPDGSVPAFSAWLGVGDEWDARSKKRLKTELESRDE
jgi:hypothetical protein